MSQTRALPLAPPEYEENNEQTTRRTIEQNFQDLGSLVASNRDKSSGPSSLAMRRFQFLLMGAPRG